MPWRIGKARIVLSDLVATAAVNKSERQLNIHRSAPVAGRLECGDRIDAGLDRIGIRHIEIAGRNPGAGVSQFADCGVQLGAITTVEHDLGAVLGEP